MSELVVRPVITLTFEQRKASSKCCGAPLNPGPEPEAYACTGCGQPCERVMSGPVEVTARG